MNSSRVSESTTMAGRPIVITAEDYQQLAALLNSNVVRLVNGPDRLDELQAELGGAQIVTQDEMPGDVVTMNSTVTVRDLGTSEVETYTLVFPERADIAHHKLSVLAPTGTAILGTRAGDQIRWRVQHGWRHLRVEQVIHQHQRDGPLRIQGRTHSAGANEVEERQPQQKQFYHHTDGNDR